MSTDLEQALRHAFREAAETVVPRPDPVRRLLRRRQRRWAGLGAFAAAVAATAALVPALQPAAPDEQRRPLPPLPKWTLALVESPTRGSLAGDRDLLRAVQDAAAYGTDGIKVLFLGDVHDHRFLVFVRYDQESAMVYHSDGPGETSVADLVRTAVPGQLGPLVTVAGREAPLGLALAPATCTIARSIGVSTGVGNTVERKWTDVPDGSWTVRGPSDLPERWQVTCDGVVRSEAPADEIRDFDHEIDVIAAAAVQHGPVLPRWTGPIEGTTGTWTLSTAQLPDNSVAVTLSTGPADRMTVVTGFSPPQDEGRGLMSTAISADPDVIAIRVPYQPGYLGERVLIYTAKPGAAGATVRAEIGTMSKPLAGGVAVMNTKGGPVTVTDAAGAELGTTWLLEEVPQLFGEEIVSNWTE
jgi:hypothetical protein